MMIMTAATDIARGIMRDTDDTRTIRATQVEARVQDYCDDPRTTQGMVDLVRFNAVKILLEKGWVITA